MGGPQNKTQRAAGGRWAPGSSGNPGGIGRHVKTLRARIREATRDGEELIELHLKVIRDEITQEVPVKVGEAYELAKVHPSIKDKQSSAGWLADRFWGKAPDKIEISDADERAAELRSMARSELVAAVVANLSREELEAAIAARAEEAADNADISARADEPEEKP